MNYYRRYIGDFQRDTGHLSLAEVGAYDRLLDHYYATEKALPVELDILCRICRAVTADERTAVTYVAKEFFPATSDRGRHNNRADEEIRIATTTVEAQRDSGRRTASRRYGHRSTEQLTDLVDLASEGRSQVQPPTTNHQPPTTNLPVPATSEKLTPAQRAGRTIPAWQAYSTAFKERYGVEPTRNAKMNGMVSKLLDRVPVEEAPQIMEFYVRHQRPLYVSARHCLDLLLRDAETVRTEMLAGLAAVGGGKQSRLEDLNFEAARRFREGTG